MKKTLNMKLLDLFLTVGAVSILASCSPTYYNYYQVYKVKPVEDSKNITKTTSGYVYENSDCAVRYYFWENGGTSCYEMYNKTDNMMKVNLNKSFFVKNGVAHSVFRHREWSESESDSYMVSNSSSASLYGRYGTNWFGNRPYDYAIVGNFGGTIYQPSVSVSTSATAGFSKSTESGIMVEEDSIVYIPPKASTYISDYVINDEKIRMCGLYLYPKEKSEISFMREDTPISFSNYITYSICGSEIEKNINNSFYVYSIINYTEPAISDMVEKKPVCEEVKTREHKKLYDKVFNVDTSDCFYYLYNSTTKYSLSKFNNYYWDAKKSGYRCVK